MYPLSLMATALKLPFYSLPEGSKVKNKGRKKRRELIKKSCSHWPEWTIGRQEEGGSNTETVVNESFTAFHTKPATRTQLVQVRSYGDGQKIIERDAGVEILAKFAEMAYL